jgi:hypothetical protein
MDFDNTFFGPLNKQYCIYFYFLSLFGFMLLVVFLFSSLLVGLNKRKGLDYYMQVVGISLGYGMLYFQNRLLHSMCLGNM